MEIKSKINFNYRIMDLKFYNSIAKLSREKKKNLQTLLAKKKLK